MSDLTLQSPEPTIMATAWEAFYKNRYAAFVLWLFGMGLMLAFFFVEPVRNQFQQIGLWKTQAGWIFSAISTGIFGGLAPILVERIVTKEGNFGSSKQLFFYTISNFLFWAAKGVEIDFWYQAQGMIWGTDAQVWTIIGKTFLDQFVYVPAIGIVNAVWFYRWRDAGYRLGKNPFQPSWTWYKKNVLAILVSNWFVWVPSVAMIYCLPSNLQLPIQNLILCLWVMMLALMAKE